MKVRIASLISVLSVVSDAPNAPRARGLILQWILDEAQRTGGSKHRIRRNLIWSNHVRGTDATDRFASLVWDAAANQSHGPLITTVRATGDEQALKTHLESLTPQRTPSSLWIERQVLDHDLDRKLARNLQRRSRMDHHDLRSIIGLWLSRWGAEGTFDAVLAVEGTVHIGVLTRFIKGKIRSHHFRRGTEPLERRYGARTENEVARRREVGNAAWITSGAECLDNDSCSAVPVFGEDDTPIGVDFRDNAESPEELVIRRLETARIIRSMRIHTRINHGSAGERFARVLGHMAGGMTPPQIAVLEGVSEGRARKLMQEVRSGLRRSLSRDEAQGAILRAIEDEPFSTLGEIRDTLEIESDTVTKCLNYLVQEGEVTEFSGKSYVLTRNL